MGVDNSVVIGGDCGTGRVSGGGRGCNWDKW